MCVVIWCGIWECFVCILWIYIASTSILSTTTEMSLITIIMIMIELTPKRKRTIRICKKTGSNKHAFRIIFIVIKNDVMYEKDHHHHRHHDVQWQRICRLSVCATNQPKAVQNVHFFSLIALWCSSALFKHVHTHTHTFTYAHMQSRIRWKREKEW